MSGSPLEVELIESIAADSGIDLFCGPDRRAYVTLSGLDGRRETYSVSDLEFEHHVRRLLLRAGKSPTKTRVSTIVGGCEALAGQGEQRQVYTRVADLGDQVVIDLADQAGQVSVCTPDGRRVDDEPQVPFVRAAGMQALPIPVSQPGVLDELRALCAEMSDDAFLIVIGWLVITLRGRAPYPVLFLQGGHGSGKSVTARLLRRLVDPNTAPLRSLPGSERDLAIMADNSAVLFFDNVSEITGDTSDVLCRFSSGIGFSTRRLYTNRAEELFDIARPVLLTAITNVVTAEDLRDRTYHVRVYPPATRITEVALLERFQEIQAGVLAALLDAVCATLMPSPAVLGADLPRLADAAVTGNAGLARLGYGEQAFTNALANLGVSEHLHHRLGTR